MPVLPALGPLSSLWSAATGLKERSREDERTVAQTIRHAIKVYLRGPTP